MTLKLLLCIIKKTKNVVDRNRLSCYYKRAAERAAQNIEAWLSLVERYIRDVEVAGSNPVASIFFVKFNFKKNLKKLKIVIDR